MFLQVYSYLQGWITSRLLCCLICYLHSFRLSYQILHGEQRLSLDLFYKASIDYNRDTGRKKNRHDSETESMDGQEDFRKRSDAFLVKELNSDLVCGSTSRDTLQAAEQNVKHTERPDKPHREPLGSGGRGGRRTLMNVDNLV